ncbi:hypothetical protein OSB04_006421 [Centaurea solstitialis]|uniref:Integrase catalytic domain-containing protein n=1 Tax=Centaurea solstitialis TaxID=347529 RepID=A0AA38WSN6_9ASTR|nr:hypothetical protein OSB04_006421 [Centaurea solstitialis]
MNKLVSKCLVKGLPETRLSKNTLCPACEKGKMKRSSHPPRIDTNSKSPLDMIHMDLCGPMRVESLARKKYMLVLVDEFSRFTWLEFLRAKSDAADRIIAFIKRIQVLLGRRVKKLRSDNGTEFRNAKLQSFLEDFRNPIYCDSKSAIQITENPVQHSRTKHIDIRYHFIKDHAEKGNVELYFVESDYQLADLFTKPFDEKRHFFLLSKLGMLDLPA